MRWRAAASAAAAGLLAGCAASGAAERCDAILPSAAASPAGPLLGEGMGVQVQFWYLQPGDLDRIAATGFGVVRWGIPWDKVEIAPGVYDWREADRFMRALAGARLRSVVILAYGNPLYAGPDGAPAADARVDARPPTGPVARAAFARFAAAAAARYRDQPVTWEIWNEPDSATFWQPSPDPGAYAQLARETCAAIRAASPTARVLGGAGAAMPNAVAHRDNIYAALARAGAIACLDGVSSHAYRMSGFYRQPDPESIAADNAASRRYLHADLGLPADKRLVTTEWGYPSGVVGADRQAAYLLRANLMNAATGVPLTIWYEWRDSRADDEGPESQFGLSTMTGGPKSRRDAFATFAAIARARLVGRLRSSCDDARLFLLDRAGERFIVGWLRSDDQRRAATLRVNGVARGALSFMPALVRLPS